MRLKMWWGSLAVLGMAMGTSVALIGQEGAPLPKKEASALTATKLDLHAQRDVQETKKEEVKKLRSGAQIDWAKGIVTSWVEYGGKEDINTAMVLCESIAQQRALEAVNQIQVNDQVSVDGIKKTLIFDALIKDFKVEQVKVSPLLIKMEIPLTSIRSKVVTLLTVAEPAKTEASKPEVKSEVKTEVKTEEKTAAKTEAPKADEAPLFLILDARDPALAKFFEGVDLKDDKALQKKFEEYQNEKTKGTFKAVRPALLPKIVVKDGDKQEVVHEYATVNENVKKSGLVAQYIELDVRHSTKDLQEALDNLNKVDDKKTGGVLRPKDVDVLQAFFKVPEGTFAPKAKMPTTLTALFRTRPAGAFFFAQAAAEEDVAFDDAPPGPAKIKATVVKADASSQVATIYMTKKEFDEFKTKNGEERAKDALKNAQVIIVGQGSIAGRHGMLPLSTETQYAFRNE